MSDGRPEPCLTRVCYYLQTHKDPEQILRLVRRIKEGSPGSVVLVHHDDSAAPLDAGLFAGLPEVHVLNGPGGYGDFSHLDRLFTAVDWLESRGIEYDWMQNLTGQDYPIRSVADIERRMAESNSDGYLRYAPVFPEQAPPHVDWGAGPEYRLCSPWDTDMRFNYSYRWFGRPSVAKQRWLRPFALINRVQPWLRLHLGFSAIGLRRKSTIFADDFICYGGPFFCSLSATCIRYLREFARDNPGIVEYFRTLVAPDEVFMHTVLVNAGKFRFLPAGTHYVDWTNSHYNHPKILGTEDLPAMLASGAHWARKFEGGAEVLDRLDELSSGQPAP